MLILVIVGTTRISLALDRPQPIRLFQKLKMRTQLQKHSEQDQLKTRVNTTALAVTMGVFGVHRLYLGTHHRVPIMYTLTIGGGFGVLPASDIIAIWIDPKTESFMNNDSFVMWIK
jgi:TM2 domain-containing membrane protein YozV